MTPHDFFNDVRYQFSSTLPIGTVVKLQVDSGDNSPWYAINTADFYNVAAAITQPCQLDQRHPVPLRRRRHRRERCDHRAAERDQRGRDLRADRLHPAGHVYNQ